MINTIYYKVTGGQPLDFCIDYRDRAKTVESIFSVFAREKGGIGFVRQMRDRFGGVIFKGAAPTGWREHKTPCRDGTYFAKPVKRGDGAAEGKSFQSEIDALPLLPSDDEFCTRFEFPRSVEYKKEGSNGSAGISQGWNTAQIAWTGDGETFWITLPDFDACVTSYEERGYQVTPSSWSVPEGMQRSTRAHYELALAQAAVAAEDAECAA